MRVESRRSRRICWRNTVIIFVRGGVEHIQRINVNARSLAAYSMIQNLILRFTCQCGFRRAAPPLKSSTPLILRIKRAKEFISPVFIRHHLKEGFFDSWKRHILIAGIISVFNGRAVLWKPHGGTATKTYTWGESKVESAGME